MSKTTSVASAGTDIVFAKKKVPEVSKFEIPSGVKFAFTTDIVKSAALVPSTFAHVILFTFTILSEATVNKVVVVVAVRLYQPTRP